MIGASRIPNPIDESRRIGTVTTATPQYVTLNLPNAGTAGPVVYHGDTLARGEVGEYVCFPRGDVIVLGRISKVELPERDRLAVEPSVTTMGRLDPIGTVALLTDVDLRSGNVSGSVNTPPRLGTAG